MVAVSHDFFSCWSHLVSTPFFGREVAVTVGMKILFSEDPSGEGGSPGNEQPKAPVVPANAPSPENKPADPPATRTVIDGDRTERELAIELQLEAEKAARKKEQNLINELENENHQLKQIPTDKKKKGGPISRILGWED
jgi:hypothetical protein